MAHTKLKRLLSDAEQLADRVRGRGRSADPVDEVVEAIRAIQRDLILADHHIHALDLPIAGNIAPEASVIASSVYSERDPAESWGTDRLRNERMLQLPVTSGKLDCISLLVDADRDTELRYRLHQGPENGPPTPKPG